MALGLTQVLTEINTRNISWGVKAADAWGWQPYHLHVPFVLKSPSLNLLEPSGPVQTCNCIAFTLVRHFPVFIVTLLFVFQIPVLLFSFGVFYVLVSHIYSSEPFDSRQRQQIFLFSEGTRLTLGSFRPPVCWKRYKLLYRPYTQLVFDWH
jgi:hypothetical protein